MSDGLDLLQIRAASQAESEPLYGIYEELVARGAAVPERGRPLREVFDHGWIRDRRVYVGIQDGEVVGGYFIRTNFPAFAARIAQGGYLVRSDLRRIGIGRRLAEHSIQEARALGYTAMMFNLVMETNPSRHLYESLGFRVIGRIPAIRREEGALIYWRDLQADDRGNA